MLSVVSLHPREGTEYAVDPATGCWNWLKGKNDRGYAWGHAHRRYWAEVNGPVPGGHHIHHKCRNPSCVNPEHLEPKEACQHLAEHMRAVSPHSLELVLEIRELTAQGLPAREIAERFGLNPDSVNEIASGRNWKDVGGPLGAQPKNCAYLRCSKPLPADRRRHRIYCGHTCRQGAFMARKRGEQ